MGGIKMQKELKREIKDFYNNNPEFVTSPFTYTGEINERGKKLFEGINLKDKKILEIGCGNGHIISYCKEKGAKCYAIDLSNNAIKKARLNYKGIKFYVEDIEDLKKMKEKKFDIIIILEVIEHAIDYRKTLEIISNLMNKKGNLILSCPNYFNLCGLIKVISEIFIGHNKWAPFAEWKKEANENFITYFGVKKEVRRYFKIQKIETIDILRGIFPFFYINYKIEKNKFVRKIRRYLELRKKSILLKYFGSNLILRGVKN
jgi:2-polyprenyl-3-methyl-5-hydroxy-6-metoxy-1,4-benzoquinol methylase